MQIVALLFTMEVIEASWTKLFLELQLFELHFLFEHLKYLFYRPYLNIYFTSFSSGVMSDINESLENDYILEN